MSLSYMSAGPSTSSTIMVSHRIQRGSSSFTPTPQENAHFPFGEMRRTHIVRIASLSPSVQIMRLPRCSRPNTLTGSNACCSFSFVSSSFIGCPLVCPRLLSGRRGSVRDRSANDRHIRSRQGGAGLHLPATMRIFVERLRSRRHRAFGFGCLCSSRVADFAGTLGRRICRSSISPNKALQIIRSAPLGSDILDSLNLAPCSHARILIYRSYLNFLVRPLEKV